MRTYRVSVVRTNPEKDVSNTHYYVILEAESADAARDRAMHKARVDYPGDIFNFDSCKELRPRARVECS